MIVTLNSLLEYWIDKHEELNEKDYSLFRQTMDIRSFFVPLSFGWIIE